ncbi:phosphodiester glycosidase family protein [Paenibacillus sp. CAU 1782]
MKVKQRAKTAKVIAVALTLAMGCGYWGDVLPGAKGIEVSAAAAASSKAVEKIAGAESVYWTYQASEKLNAPLALAGGGAFLTTGKGLVIVVDGNGKELFRKNIYTELSAPAQGKDGDIWMTGKSGRLYRYEVKGSGSQAAMFYFQGKTEGLLPSAVVADGEGTPYFFYEHAVLSLDKDGEKEMVLLPTGIKVQQIVPATQGVFALSSNGVLYRIAGGERLWQTDAGIAAKGAKIAADGSGGVLLAAGKALAGYDEQGELRFRRELSAPPAGGWASLLALPGGDAGAFIAAQASGNELFSFRLSDGAELWRRSVAGADGFGPGALAAESASGVVLAASRSGALYGIAAKDGAIAYSFKPAAASVAAGAASLGGGKVLFASGQALVAAGPNRPVAISYPSGKLKLSLGSRLLLGDKLKLTPAADVRYRSDNGKIVTISPEGIVTPIAAGKANITVEVTTPGYKGQYVLPVEISAAAANLKAIYVAQKVKVGNRTFTVQTVTVPKNMPVTLGAGSRLVGTTSSLSDIAKNYSAVAAINGTYFSAYGGFPDPYGMMIADGKLQHIGNTGTTIGFTWDGTVLMERLRVTISGGTDGSYSHPNNWYAYFMNRVPTEGSSAAVMFTPKRGSKIGFSFGQSVTVRNGVVTRVASNENAAIPADGYVLVFTGGEEGLAKRFKVGTKVDYKVETKNLEGKEVDWTRVHTAVGAGPRLVLDGKTALKAAEEGFTEAKILTSAAARSGIFVKKDGSIVLATIGSATMQQWADIMVKLGAVQGMNLDGGASSGLYANGKTITQPGRLLSNSLLFGPQLKW